MGWSCRADAANAESAVFAALKAAGMMDKSSNTWTNRGAKYFAEGGGRREYDDGRITATVYRMSGANHCYRFGSLHISPDGEVLRWPGVPAAIIKQVNSEAGF